MPRQPIGAEAMTAAERQARRRARVKQQPRQPPLAETMLAAALRASNVSAVHPLADLFPMLDDAELITLAEDIVKNGLVQPIVRGYWRMQGEEIFGIVDGRNRLAACQFVGVEPVYRDLERGADTDSFIVSANLSRRFLDRRDQAGLRALANPSPATLAVLNALAARRSGQ